MKTNSIILLIAAALLVAACSDQTDNMEEGAYVPLEQATMQTPHDDLDDHILFVPETVEWRPGPASLEEGAEIAILEGDPSSDGVFTLRLRMPDGFQISPHWHPAVERVTVLSGAFLLGSGEDVDRQNVERLLPGSYTSMPPGMRHYAVMDGETVIQLTSIGPWKINYVNDADDPRQRD